MGTNPTDSNRHVEQYRDDTRQYGKGNVYTATLDHVSGNQEQLSDFPPNSVRHSRKPAQRSPDSYAVPYRSGAPAKPYAVLYRSGSPPKPKA